MINDLEEVQWAYLLDPTFQQVNSSGKPLTGGWLEVYIHGTRTKYYCASDFDGTLHPFKIPLDSLGANIVLASPAHAYDIYVYNVYGNLVMSRYNVVPSTGDGTVIKDIVNITSNDGTVNVQSSDQTNWDLSIKDTTDAVELLQDTVASAVSSINDRIDDIEFDLSNKKDKQTAKSFDGSATKTIKKITQNANGVVNVEFEDIDLPPEVPNVEITSPNGTIDVQSSTDVQTNTKTFEIDITKTSMDFFDGYCSKYHYEDRPSNTNAAIWCYVDQWSEYKYQGDFITNNWQANDNISFVLKPGLYLITATIRYDMHNEWSDPSNPNPSKSNSDEYIRIATGAYNGLENGTRYKDWTQEYQLGENSIQLSFVRNVMNDSSYDYMNNNNTLYFDPYLPYGVNYVYLDHLQIVKLDSIVGNAGGGGGETYTAGDAIDITNNEISVKVNPASGIDIVDDKLVVKVGNGLTIDPVSGVVVVNTEVNDVVQTVEKLKQDLDTQLTVNFDMPNIDNVYDFADPTVIGMSNGAVMLCQAFTVPINHDIRVDDGETENPTLIGIYAKQAFSGKKIMLALYVYDFDTGYTDYVGDTGPVEVTQGRNEFPLVHINPDISELKSSCVYYASLYLPSNAHSNGLYLAGCPSYSNASYINATPRFTVGVENITYNNQEIDMSNATTGRLDYNDGNGNYYIGPWSDNYNERPAIPRFFMQIRNGDAEAPVVVEPFTDIGSYTLKNTSSVNDVFGSTITVNTSNYGAMFMEVTPAQDVDVTGWVCYDNYSIDERNWYGMVFDSNFENQLSSNSNGTVSELGEISTGVYGHEFTRSTPLHLTANTTYRFLVGIPHSNSDMLLQYNTPSVPKNLHLFESGYNVSQWVSYSRANDAQGIDFLIKDANHEWRI